MAGRLKDKEYKELAMEFYILLGPAFFLMPIGKIKKALEEQDAKVDYPMYCGLYPETINARYVLYTYGDMEVYPGCMWTNETGQWRASDFYDRLRRLVRHCRSVLLGLDDLTWDYLDAMYERKKNG